MRDGSVGRLGSTIRGRSIGAIERHAARQTSRPIEPDAIEHAGDKLGLFRCEQLGEPFLADMRDQAAFLSDELELFLGVALCPSSEHSARIAA